MRSSRAESEEDIEQAYYDDYQAERKLLIDAEFDSARSFDKHLIALSSAALGLSIAFLEKIAPRPVCIWIISVAWAMFILSLITELVSFHLCQAAMRKQRDLNDAAFLVHGRLQDVDTNPYVWWQQVLTYLSLAFFIAGTLLLVRFSAINVHHKENLMRQTTSAKPAVTPKPVPPVVQPAPPNPVRNPAAPPNPPVPRPSAPKPGR